MFRYIQFTFLFVITLPYCASVFAAEKRIVTLAPHLTELVYALKQEKHLLAVSDFSDYPLAAQKLTSVANYQGVNIAQIVRLNPTHILAWKGGNKAQDIAKLESLGFSVLSTAPTDISELANNILHIGNFLGAEKNAQALAGKLTHTINNLRKEADTNPMTALYFMNQAPLSGIGNDAWINSLLALCGVTNIYASAISSYISIDIGDVIRQQPSVLIAATGAPVTLADSIWHKHNPVFSPHLINVDADALHRFTDRSVQEISRLCTELKQIKAGKSIPAESN